MLNISSENNVVGFNSFKQKQQQKNILMNKFIIWTTW